MKEKFKDVLTTGSIRIQLRSGDKDDDSNFWIVEKEEIINHIVEIGTEYKNAGDSLTLRQLYYQLVARDLIPNHDKVYKKISKIKDDVVYSGLLDWSVFEDRGRVPHRAYFEDSVSGALQRAIDFYQLDRQKGQNTHIEVWTEKDAISGILKKVVDRFTIRLVVNKGYNSSTAMYNSYDRFERALRVGKRVLILYFGDHDPSGLDMVRDINDRILFMLCNGEKKKYGAIQKVINDWRYSIEYLSDAWYSIHNKWKNEQTGELDWVTAFFSHHFNIRHIGLTMDQITKYRPPHNPAKLTDPRAKWYIERLSVL